MCVELLEISSTRLSQYEKLEGIWDERNPQDEFPQARSSAEIWPCPQEKIWAKTQITCLLANMNNVQIKPPAPVELI